MTVKRLERLPTWLLSRAQARSHDLLSRALAAAGARGYHYRLLAAAADDGPQSQADLGRVTGIDRKDVAIVVAELVSAGLVVREHDPADGRRNIVRITHAGRARLRHLEDVVRAVQDEVLAPLDPQERAVLTELLARLGPPDDSGT